MLYNVACFRAVAVSLIIITNDAQRIEHLIDEIDTQLASGKEAFQAVVDSGVSRLIPVAMAALTTILGMVPLLQDAFFVSMAVTIMFGLGFATVLTLIVVPVLYAVFFRVPNPQAT